MNDTTGQGKFDVLQEELKSLDLDIDNMTRQGHDNGSNMKGNFKGYTRKFGYKSKSFSVSTWLS